MKKRILDALKYNKLVVKTYNGMMNRIHQLVMSTEVAEVRPILCRTNSIPMRKKRINLLIPSLNIEHVYGGITTALSFFKQLCEELECDCRIIVVDAAIDQSQMVNMEDFAFVEWDGESGSRKQLVDLSSRTGKTLVVGDKDIFMTTIWWTAYMAQDIILWQAAQYKSEQKQLIYFIQDYEPGFYQWSSKYLMAESTYRMDLDVFAIFNSKLLYDFFIRQGYEFYKTCYFEPVLNEQLKEYLFNNKQGKERKKQILIYGRPGTPRNAFELIIEALRKWAEIQQDASEWNIISAGESFSDIEIDDNVKVHSLGKLTLEKYAQTMLESKIGISLMVSPHPSYPPLEMSTFGMKVITNTYANKDLRDFNENIISLDNCSAMNIAKQLSKLCNDDCEAQIELNNNYVNGSISWTDIIQEIKTFLF